MNISIPEEPLAKCKEMVQEFQKTHSEFKEIGGYLVGTYDSDFTVKDFLLDEKAESTTTRIKLSADCFHRVEEYLTKNPELLYIGTWHVHPGNSKPAFSVTDQSTLFLEKLVIETDNPKEFRCPRIHLIFSEDLQEISGYTMQVSLDYQLDDYWTLEKQVKDSDVDLIGNITDKLSEIKKEFQKYRKSKKIEVLITSFSELSLIREDVERLLDLVEDITDFQDIYSILHQERKNLEKELTSLIKKGDSLGIFRLTEDEKIEFHEYRPQLIKEFQEDGTLLGFWRHYLVEQPPLEFQEIFFANFFRKIEANSTGFSIYILSDPSSIQFYNLELMELTGIAFKDVQITLEEEA